MDERSARVGSGMLGRVLPVRIAGCGIGFPAGGRWVLNDEIHALRHGADWQRVMNEKGADPGYYEANLGFRRRYWVQTPGEENAHGKLTSMDLMSVASEQALERAGKQVSEIDALIAVTITSPFYTTAVAARLAQQLGVQAPSFDLRTGCATGIFALVIAAQLIEGGARNVLIAAGDTTSKVLNPTNNTAYAGGDAGAAVVVSRSGSSAGMLAHYIDTDGTFSGHTGVPGLLPPTIADIEAKRYYLEYRDEGKDAELDRAWKRIPDELYKRSGLTAKDITCYVPHQAAKRQLELASREAGIPDGRTVQVLGEYGNCGPATIFLALERAMMEQRINTGDRYMLAAAGGGLSWGGVIMQH
ncbi:MAG: 3-oxoacyl-ACP synthase III family protein [Flavobacteriales bacterium]